MQDEKCDDMKKTNSISQTRIKEREALALQLSREMAILDEATRIEEAEERGKLEGKKQQRINIAKKLINTQLSDEDIIKATDLTTEELQQIKSQLQQPHK